jgi:DNA-binding NtrC family response regulator
VPLVLPPLRDRRLDIPPLLLYFLARHLKEGGRGPRCFSLDAVERLTQYSWPGNVRELKNLVERLMVTTDAEEITSAELPDYITICEPAEAPPVPRTNDELKALKKQLHDRASSELERSFVLDALRRNDWNVSRAARETGMLRPNFHALMRKYGIRADEP